MIFPKCKHLSPRTREFLAFLNANLTTKHNNKHTLIALLTNKALDLERQAFMVHALAKPLPRWQSPTPTLTERECEIEAAAFLERHLLIRVSKKAFKSKLLVDAVMKINRFQHAMERGESLDEAETCDSCKRLRAKIKVLECRAMPATTEEDAIQLLKFWIETTFHVGHGKYSRQQLRAEANRILTESGYLPMTKACGLWRRVLHGILGNANPSQYRALRLTRRSEV